MFWFEGQFGCDVRLFVDAVKCLYACPLTKPINPPSDEAGVVDGNDEGSELRSALGIGVDWLTVVGPMNFSLAQPITKNSGDITETFRFNLGTTF